MEMQAVGRAVRKGQTNKVNVFVSYIKRTLDDQHRFKHNGKTLIAMKLLGDKEKDPMYMEDDGTATMTTEQKQEYLRQQFTLRELFGMQFSSNADINE